MSTGDHWCTPPELWEPAAELLGGISLDPFSNEHSTVEAHVKFDGVNGCGFKERFSDTNFVNGPWSKNKQVVEKCHSEWLFGCSIVQVIPTSLNASYWSLIEQAPAVCRPRRRVAFLRDGKPVKSNRQDCVIVCWHPDVWRFRALYRSVGETRFG